MNTRFWKARAVCAGLLLCLLVVGMGFATSGCGAGKVTPSPSGQGAPDAAGNVAPFTPNYLVAIAPARWRGNRVTWRITEGGTSHVPGVNIKRAVRAGFNQWLPAMSGCRYPVSIEEAKDGEKEDITIRMVESGELESNLLGETDVNIDADGYIVSTPMKLKKSMLPNRIRDVAAHELGHALGVRGHSPFEGDAMYPIVAWGRVPSQRDINTIATLYNDQTPRPLYSRATTQTVFHFGVAGDETQESGAACADE